MTVELWTQRPDQRVTDFDKDVYLRGWYRRVPFDEAVERMVPLLRGQMRPKGAMMAGADAVTGFAIDLLRAALGEDT